MKYLVYIFAGLFMTLHVSARVIQVGSSHTVHTIQEALRVAINGDSIIVYGGNYREKNISITKSITLIGKNFPVLDGEHLYEIISIRAPFVTIEGFKIVHSGVSSIEDFAGIKICNVPHAIIRNNILDDTFFGIYSQYGMQGLIENNRLRAYGKQEQQSGNGIHCWKSDRMRIIGNSIIGHRDGIYFEFVTNSVIWKNHSEKNIRYGLHFMFSNTDAYISNQFINNGAGVAVMFSHHVKMYDNSFNDNTGDGSYGLLLKEINDGYLLNNRFNGNTIGIYFEGANRLQVEKNIFKNNGWAIKMQANCMDISVFSNNFYSNTFDVATNGSLVLNSFNGNYWDKYEGYDLDKDKKGDVPYHPVSLYAMIVEQNPTAMILFRSFMATLLDKTEKLVPSVTPDQLKDNLPLMKPFPL
ncbi:MAG TPA: nitrous oxide reductase family maturation protein NosD [Ferruginibacter sp.]|nr:nitrous oxide reductase family maturation protein NosD [Ferruginibacter sp.]